MEISHKKTFNRRKFVSVGLLLTLIVLVITAIVIQIFEALENELFTHLFLVTHIFTGLTFTILSVLHAKMNWQSMKTYVKSKQHIFSKEIVYALLLTVLTIFIGILFVFVFIH
jgi:hypothetical protein